MEEKNKNQKTMPKDHVAVILEEIRSQNKLFGERLSGVSEKLENVSIKQESFSEKLEGVSVKVDLVIEDIDEIKIRLKSVEDEVKEINGKLDEKVDKKVVKNHEERIMKLEKAVAI